MGWFHALSINMILLHTEMDILHTILQWFRDTYIVDIATIAGLIIAVITLWQASGARSKAEAARQAVNDLKLQLNEVNLVADLTRALAIMEEIKRLQSTEEWAVLRERYGHLRSVLSTVVSTYTIFTSAEKKNLSGATAQFRVAEESIDKELREANLPVDQRNPVYQPLDWTTLNHVINDQMEKVEPILAHARAQIGEYYASK